MKKFTLEARGHRSNETVWCTTDKEGKPIMLHHMYRRSFLGRKREVVEDILVNTIANAKYNKKTGKITFTADSIVSYYKPMKAGGEEMRMFKQTVPAKKTKIRFYDTPDHELVTTLDEEIKIKFD